MVLSRSRPILRRATCTKYHPVPARSHTTPHSTRQVYSQLALDPPAEPKVGAKKSRKRLQDLPSSYTLPDGTPAKPLGDWRANILIKDASSFHDALPATVAIDAETDSIREQDTSGGETPSLDHGDSASLPVKPQRAHKKASTASAIESGSTTKRGRPKKKLVQTLPPPELYEGNEEPSATPRTILAQEIQENLQKFPHCLLLTRVGQFYESYFDQAEEIAHLLNIKLTSRKWGGQRVAMCGFPLIHLDKHLKVLVQQHRRFVALCEEFHKEAFGAKEFERRVTRIITPGTLIDEPFLNAHENNFLLAISIPTPQPHAQIKKETNIGLAWIDVSTGEFYSKHSSLESVQDQLARINPREVVLSDVFQNVKDHPLLDALREENCFLSFTGEFSSAGNARDPIEEAGNSIQQTSEPGRKPDQISLTPREQRAVDMLTSYLTANLLESMPPLMDPVQDNTGHMQIDAHTIKALEIRESNYEGGTRGSLFSAIKRTVTNGGTRLLSRWLCSPSTTLSEIIARQSLVGFFEQRPHLAADLVQLLTHIDDTSRLTQKFLVGRGDASDLLAISKTVHTWSSVLKTLIAEKSLEKKERSDFDSQEWSSVDALVSRMQILAKLSDKIDNALGVDENEGSMTENGEPPSDVNSDRVSEILCGTTQLLNWKLSSSRWPIRPQFSKKLQTLHDQFLRLLTEKDNMEKELRTRYGAASLTLRASPGQGMHVHLSRKRDQNKLNSDPTFVSIYESASTKCYFYKDWSLLGNQIAEAILQLTQAEKEAFEILREMVNEFAYPLRKNSEIIDELDVALSFAKVAAELKFVRPTVVDDNIYHVTNGRHPSVEMGLLSSGRVFTPNSVNLNSDAQVHVITGPNMAGKSTFLRQTALISILAQIGSFVPAEAATIGIVDKLFSRIGAKDDLFRDRSTFMVEMLETADILRRATKRSLVIMDEVGRGTTVSDGLAIAFATVHHLCTVNQCRTLFATHFHELANMLGHTTEATGTGAYKSVRFYCTDVDEAHDGYFAYSYRLRTGVNWDSHGLKVAQLAGLPEAAIEVASNTLGWLKQNSHKDNQISEAPVVHRPYSFVEQAKLKL